MVMTPQAAKGAGRGWVWLLAAVATLIVALSVYAGETWGLYAFGGLILFLLVATLMCIPLVWLLARLSGKRNRKGDEEQ